MISRVSALVFFLLCLNVVVFSQFVVGFKADKVIGCDTLTVYFTDLTTATNLEAWLWNFGDNTFSEERNPIHKYSAPGVYSVQLTIMRSTSTTPQTSTTLKPKYITVRKPPVAYFTSSTAQSNTTFAVALNCASHLDSAGFIYNWQFGDDNEGVGSSLVHTYGAEGTYNIALRVTDNNSCTKDTSGSITLRDSLKIPNIFSPNNDGLNDEFFIVSNGIQDLSFQVFDRWGSLQYKNIAKSIRWDGRNYAGLLLSPGTYYYVLSSKGGNTEINKSGFIEISY